MEVDRRPLYRKYEVRRCDGQDLPGDKHEKCRLFVLDLDHDPAALVALAAYAEAVRHTRPKLSLDLRLAIDTGLWIERPLPDTGKPEGER